jgi:hypothetical protein
MQLLLDSCSSNWGASGLNLVIIEKNLYFQYLINIQVKRFAPEWTMLEI